MSRSVKIILVAVGGGTLAYGLVVFSGILALRRNIPAIGVTLEQLAPTASDVSTPRVAIGWTLALAALSIAVSAIVVWAALRRSLATAVTLTSSFTLVVVALAIRSLAERDSTGASKSFILGNSDSRMDIFDFPDWVAAGSQEASVYVAVFAALLALVCRRVGSQRPSAPGESTQGAA